MLPPTPVRMFGGALGLGQLGPVARVAGFCIALGAAQEDILGAVGPCSTSRRARRPLRHAERVEAFSPVSRAGPHEGMQLPFCEPLGRLVLHIVEETEFRLPGVPPGCWQSVVG